MMHSTRLTLLLVSLIGLFMADGVVAQDSFWESTSADPSLRVRSLFSSSNGVVFAGTDSVLLRSIDLGQHWTVSGPAGVNALAEDASGVLFTAGYNGVHRSTDGGTTWAEVLPAPTRRDCRDSVQYYDVTVLDKAVVVVGIVEEGNGNCKRAGRFFRSTDSGTTWLQKSINNPRFIAMNALNSIFVATDGVGAGGVRRSTDQGETWELVLFIDDVAAIVLAVNAEGHVFAGTGRSVISDRGIGNGIHRSTDDGDTWQRVNTGLTDTTITALSVHTNGQLFAGTENGGVFRSTDNAETWTALNGGLTNLSITALTITSDGILFASTDAGIFRSAGSVATAIEDGAAELPERFSVGQNYPNPFNPVTTIPYALRDDARVTLEVYNVLGQQVATLIHGFQQAGYQSAVWDGHDTAGTPVPSGTYFYRLIAGDFVQARTMVLLR